MALASRAVLGLTFATVTPSVQGHSFLAEPPARNVVANQEGKEYCPHCLQAGGPDTVSTRGEGQWPTKDAPQSHGLCGDPVQGAQVQSDWRDETYLVPSPVQRSYTAGEIVEFQIGVAAHHQGHYEFRICDKALDGQTLGSREEGQACLDAWVLERAPLRSSCQPNDSDPDCQPIDEAHPGRWYLPPEGWGTPFSELQASGEANSLPHMTEMHSMRYIIPAQLSCTHCTLQWYWSTGNTCLYDSGYFEYFKRMEEAGWRAADWCNFCTPGNTCTSVCCGAISGRFAEEFWNCADVAVHPSGQEPPAPTQAPAEPTPLPAPTPMPTADSGAHSPDSAPCSALWGQCGGRLWSGPVCCQPGSQCVGVTEPWYSQCVPVDVGPAPTLSPPSTAPSTEPGPSSDTVIHQPQESTPTPTPSECAQLCSRTNLTSSGTSCTSNSADQSSCLQSFVAKGDVAIPCSWTDCGCIADGENLLECPGLAEQCGTRLAQRTALRGHASRRSLRSGAAQPLSGIALMEEAHRLSRTVDLENASDVRWNEEL